MADRRFLFQRILKEGVKEGFPPGLTQEARKWYRERSQELKDIRPERLMRRPGAIANQRSYFYRIGEMYLFRYEPRDKMDKKKLPYYDRFPLIIVTRVEKEWFEGINFHYLMYEHRAILMDRMYRFLNSDDFNNPNTRLMTLKWNRLERIGSRKYQRSCVRRYINNQVRGKFIKILPAEWDLCLMLPIERFIGASRNKVWTEGRQKW